MEKESKKVIISLSGGLDSTMLLMRYISMGCEVRSYSFSYGQKHTIEIDKVKQNISYLQSLGYPVTHQVIDLTDVFSDSASSLHVGGADIPQGHYADETMKSTVVENRNIIFSSIIYGKALAWANKTESDVIITQGLHAGDHCFPASTKIYTADGLVPFKSLKVGDMVYSYNKETGAVELNKIQDIIEKGTNNTTVIIETVYGEVEVTEEHKVYVLKDGELVMVPAKDVKIGDYIPTPVELDDILGRMGMSNVSYGEVVSITYNRRKRPIKVYDISVENNHNFFAGDGLLISNSIYPDCRPESQEMAKELYRISNWGSERVDFQAPFINITKGEVLKEGLKYMDQMGMSEDDKNYILSHTHSCYSPDSEGRSCGKCGTCVERLEAFRDCGIEDPIDYSF